MLNIGIIFAICSAIFVSLRDLFIKGNIKQSSVIIMMSTHFISLLILTPYLFFQPLKITSIKNLAIALVVTVLFTAVASIIRLNVIRRYDISLSSPIMGLVPIFMIPSNILIMHEFPSKIATIGVVISSIGVFFLTFNSNDSFKNNLRNIIMDKVSLFTLIVVIIHSITTVVDKLAINASEAFTYTYIWILCTFIVMTVYAMLFERKNLNFKNLIDKNLVIQAIFWVISFLSQALSIQYAMNIESGTTYVKTITMLNILITTVLGSYIFKENNLVKRIISVLLILIGANIVIFHML